MDSAARSTSEYKKISLEETLESLKTAQTAFPGRKPRNDLRSSGITK